MPTLNTGEYRYVTGVGYHSNMTFYPWCNVVCSVAELQHQVDKYRYLQNKIKCLHLYLHHKIYRTGNAASAKKNFLCVCSGFRLPVLFILNLKNTGTGLVPVPVMKLRNLILLKGQGHDIFYPWLFHQSNPSRPR
jgi:hypothetical protein